MVERYWVMMTQKKFAELYLGYHLHRNVEIERWINIVLAVISTGSLAGLFLTEKYRIVLTVILALAQIFTAAKPYLPYEKRVKELEKGIPPLRLVYMEIEENWLDISKGNLTDEEINNLYYRLIKKWDSIDQEILSGDVLPRKQKFVEAADAEKNKYFENLLGGNIDE